MADFKIVVTGIDELDKELEAICSVDGAKSINLAMRRAARDAVKRFVLPQVLARIPYDDGRGAYKDDGQHLQDQVKVKAIRRSRTKVGFRVGFDDELFKGPTYYAGYIEFGWDHKGGFHVEADSFLRQALYPQTDAIVATVRAAMAAWIAERNANTPERGLFE